LCPSLLFKTFGSNQGPITLPKCYLRLQTGLSVPSVFNQLQVVESLSQGRVFGTISNQRHG
jgi:hypothetical protein